MGLRLAALQTAWHELVPTPTSPLPDIATLVAKAELLMGSPDAD